MLTIKNKDKIKQTEFHCNGVEWIVYGVDELEEYYDILMMPKVNGVYSAVKYKSVKLGRIRQSMKYYMVSSDGHLNSFILESDIKNPLDLLKFISTTYLIYHNI